MEEELCLICQETAFAPVHLSCKCKITCCCACLLRWLSSDATGANRTCPTCRQEGRILDQHDADLSSSLYQQGRALLQQASAEKFRDKSTLHKAVDFLRDAAVANPKNPSPFIGFGYMFLLLSDNQNAFRYLRHALNLLTEAHPHMALARDLFSRVAESVKHEVELEEERCAKNSKTAYDPLQFRKL